MGGFIGATTDGVTTTLGRGGSDYSASLDRRGAARRSDRDMDRRRRNADRGPTRREGALLIEEIRFDEASELASFGAKVLHPEHDRAGGSTRHSGVHLQFAPSGRERERESPSMRRIGR